MSVAAPPRKASPRLKASSLNVLNRMPQGATFNDSQVYPDACDATHPFHFDVFIPTNVLQLTYAKLSFFLRAFRSPVAAVAGGVTHAHSLSGVITPGGPHTHGLTASPAGVIDAWGYNVGLKTLGIAGQTVLTDNDFPAHTHTFTGQLTVGESAHTHPLTYGIFEGAVATNVMVLINGVDRTVALGGPAGGFVASQSELEIGQWLTLGAWNTVDLAPSGLGRIVGHLRLTGWVQSI